MTTTARTLRDAISQAKEKADQYHVHRGDGIPVVKHLTIAQIDELLLSRTFDECVYEGSSKSNLCISKTLSPTCKVTESSLATCLLISLTVGDDICGTWSEIVYVGRPGHSIDAVRKHMNAGHPPTKEYKLHIE